VSSDSLYALKTVTLDGQPADLGQYAGQVALVVNVASACGYTPQYKGLQALHEELQASGLRVLGFPSNEFGGQEPGTPEEIRTFCERKYKVTFPLFAKLQTQPGPGQSPVYAFLTRSGHVPDWNFCKYLVGRDGRVIAFFPSKVTPESKELREAIAAALAVQ
jgi:glutathione peroxidase